MDLALGDQRIRALMEHSSDIVALLNADGTVIYVSPSVTRILGYEIQERVGRSAFELIHPDDQPRVKELLAAVIHKPGATIKAETRVRHKDGSWVWVEAAATNLLDAPGVNGIVVSYHDITERKQAEESLRDANNILTLWARELERRNRELSLLSEMGDLLQACFTADEAYQALTRSVPDLFPQRSGAIYIVEPARNLAEAVVVWGDGSVGEQAFPPDDCWALRRGRLHFSEGNRAGVFCRHLGKDMVLSSICAPLMGQGETLGALHLRFDPDGVGRGETDRHLATSVAEHIALALANLKLREKLREQSVRDPLTTLYNRRYMEESLERELKRAHRENAPVAVVVFDLDHFKEINDTYGHAAGDEVLAALGPFLQSRIRQGDIACRYGGEEFVLILPGASVNDVLARAEQIRRAGQNLTVTHRGQTLESTTLSLGVAMFPEHGKTAEALLRAADEALYRAKHTGRNRVVVAG